MERELIRVTPNKEKAKSIMRMVDTRLEMLNSIDAKKYPAPLVEQYYEVVKELMTTILLLDGFKTLGHRELIEYLQEKYKKQFGEGEINFLNNLRVTRNKISYNGFFVSTEYLDARRNKIFNTINKLKKIIKEKLK